MNRTEINFREKRKSGVPSALTPEAAGKAAVCSLSLLLAVWWFWNQMPAQPPDQITDQDGARIEKGVAEREGGLGGQGSLDQAGGSADGGDAGMGNQEEANTKDGLPNGGLGEGSESPATGMAEAVQPEASSPSESPGPSEEKPAESAEATHSSNPPDPVGLENPKSVPESDFGPPVSAPPVSAPPVLQFQSGLGALVDGIDLRKPGTPYRGGNFFEVKGNARRIVYVVDKSGSMSFNKFGATQTELARAIEGLPADREFFVVFFDTWAEPMPGRNVLRKASRSSIREAVEWIRSRNTGGGTDPRDALEIALELRPEVIMLLSDGGFEMDIVRWLKGQNGPTGPVSISTIGFHDDPLTLRQIAAENRGDYRYIPP